MQDSNRLPPSFNSQTRFSEQLMFSQQIVQVARYTGWREFQTWFKWKKTNVVEKSRFYGRRSKERNKCFYVQLFLILSGLSFAVQYITGRVLTFPTLTGSHFYIKYTANSSNPSSSTKRHLVIWSNDYHISPIHDLKHLLQPLGVMFIDKSLSGHCHVTNTCDGKQTLKVINQGNAMDLDPSLIPRFYEAYKSDVEIHSVDVFVCFHPPGMCELFMPFNKSLIVIASTRYELGRFSKQRWIKWNNNLQQIASKESNVVAGNNLYDVNYIKYFTGIQPQLLSSFCGYSTETYTPSRPGFILAPIHNKGFATIFMSNYKASCFKINCTSLLLPLRTNYPHYEFSDLVSHKGIVYVPYQVSVMSLFEQYRMNIPLIFPSAQLLASWQQQYMIMSERTWAGVGGHRVSRSTIDAHPSQKHLPDPNNDVDLEAIKYWIQFSDFYQLPHITYYDSYDDLVNKLENTASWQLTKISQRMKEFNIRAKDELLTKWKRILDRIAPKRV